MPLVRSWSWSEGKIPLPPLLKGETEAHRQSPSDAAKRLLDDLSAGRRPDCVVLLAPLEKPVPSALADFGRMVASQGLDAANREFYDDDGVEVPKELQRTFDAVDGRSLQFKDQETQAFLENLFKHIDLNAIGTHANLTLWDLFHAHLFVACPSGELGMLFHAKEYPSDHPTLSPADRAALLPQCASTDPDFHLRNYLWLMSTNTIYVFNPKAPSFPKDLIHPDKADFFTIDDDAFSYEDLGVVNYANDLLALAPKRGFTAARRLKWAKTPAQIDAILNRLDKEELLSLSRWSGEGRVRVAERLNQIEQKRRHNLKTGLNQLIAKGFDALDAFMALWQTKSGDSTYSVYRAQKTLEN